MRMVMRTLHPPGQSSIDGSASIPTLFLRLFGVSMPKGEKRVESRITGSLVAQAMLDTLFASYLACAYLLAFHFQNHLLL